MSSTASLTAGALALALVLFSCVPTIAQERTQAAPQIQAMKPKFNKPEIITDEKTGVVRVLIGCHFAK